MDVDARDCWRLVLRSSSNEGPQHVALKAVGSSRNVLESQLFQCVHVLSHKARGFHV